MALQSHLQLGWGARPCIPSLSPCPGLSPERGIPLSNMDFFSWEEAPERGSAYRYQLQILQGSGALRSSVLERGLCEHLRVHSSLCLVPFRSISIIESVLGVVALFLQGAYEKAPNRKKYSHHQGSQCWSLAFIRPLLHHPFSIPFTLRRHLC